MKGGHVEDPKREKTANMAAANKFIITLTLFSLLLLIVIYLSPWTQSHNLLKVSNLPLKSTIRRLQLEAALTIKKNDTRLAIEDQLAKARSKIYKAIVEKSFELSQKNGSFIPVGTMYKNPFAFIQSHTEMMKTFKIWTYTEGDIPLMHNGPMKSIYSAEGHFIEEIERKENPLAATHPDEAHAFFIPISVAKFVHYLYTPEERFGFQQRMQTLIEDYIHIISHRYPYWNRSNGADHFYVSCHDWGPYLSLHNPKLFKNVIRVLCNANTSEGFIPRRDVSMTEINAPYDNIPIVSGGQSPQNRSIFAFFAGGNHGVVRNRLFKYWGNKEDEDIQVYTYLEKNQNYTDLLSRSKYCLCPSGYEVASARITEAIYAGCVPVTIKDRYVLPYSDVLDWSEFSVQVPVEKISDLKRILEEIPFWKYLEMQKRVMEVQKHFTVNIPAQHFDVFHMILHSVWLRRLNIRLLRS